MRSPGDFDVDIIRAPPRSAPGIKFIVVAGLNNPFLDVPVPPPPPVSLTDPMRVRRDSFGSINRAVDRNFLTFKTGDLNLTLLNRDGFFDDLFASLGPTDRWTLRVFRRGVLAFLGVVMGLGSVQFHRTNKTVELTVYGPTKVLDEADGSLVQKPTYTQFTLTSISGALVTMNTNATLQPGDVLHMTDQTNKDDLTVKSIPVGSVTQFVATAAPAHSYAAGTPLTLTTPFYRFQTIDFLVRQLFRAAYVGVGQILVSGSSFKKLAPTPVNTLGLDFSGAGALVPAAAADRNGRCYESIAISGTNNVGSFYQPDPTDPWVEEDTVATPWVDWSRYYLESDAPPPFVLRNVDNFYRPGPFTYGGFQPHQSGYNYHGATMRQYFYNSFTNPDSIRAFRTTDGVTWIDEGALANVNGGGVNVTSGFIGVEYDQVRNGLYVLYNDGTPRFKFYDIGGGTWTDLAQSDDAGMAYFGPTYQPESDLVLTIRCAAAYGPPFYVAAWRGTTRVWVRPIPPHAVTADGVFPTHTARSVGGSIYMVLRSDGATQILRTDDLFQTFVMRRIVDPTDSGLIFGSRVQGAYRVSCGNVADPARLYVALPFYAGIVPYADFTGDSAGAGLAKLATLTNAVFWVDDDLAGHFVARDLFPAGALLDITDRVKERVDTLLWDQSKQYVSVSGGGSKAIAGVAAFAASSLDLNVDLAPNEAYDQALADSYFAFIASARRYVQAVLIDPDGTIFRPLDRVLLEGVRYLVYESDHDMMKDQATLGLLEDR